MNNETVLSGDKAVFFAHIMLCFCLPGLTAVTIS